MSVPDAPPTAGVDHLVVLAADLASARPAGARRWFDMDDPALQAHVARHGPQLIHWAASGVQLQSLALEHPQAATLRAACAAIGVAHCVPVRAAQTPQLVARLSTSHGDTTLTSNA